MGRLVGRLVFVLVLAMLSRVSAAQADVTDHSGNSPLVHVQGSPRVRGSSPVIATAIEQALEQSPTFKKLVTAITATDGIVYVHQGQNRKEAEPGEGYHCGTMKRFFPACP